jgi:predicted PurR-regulated permease PerM
LQQGTVDIPPPPESVAGWPLIGKPLSNFWHLASENLEEALGQLKPQIKALGAWLLSAAAGAGFGLLQFVLAIVIAGVLLPRGEKGHQAARAVATRFVGARGEEFLDLAESTVRSVARGILGVAVIQSVLAGVGFLVAGIPGAGLLALVCLLLSVIQVGPGLVLIPCVIYVFMTDSMLTAILFLVWNVFVGLLDNVLKPLLLGRGVKVPMLVIFIGAIGGFLSMGIIGLFVGSIVLVLGYTLLQAWLSEGETPSQEETGMR